MIKKSEIVFLLFLAAASSFGQELYDRYFEEAKSFYLIREYDRALSRIRFVLKNYDNISEVPEEEKKAAEQIYFSFIDQLFKEGRHGEIAKLSAEDSYFRQLSEISPVISELGERSAAIIEAEKLAEERRTAEEERLAAVERERLRLEELEALKREAEEKHREELARIENERKTEQERLLEERRKELERLAEERRVQAEKLLAEKKAETERLLQVEAERRRQEEEARKAEQKNLLAIQEQMARERMETEEITKEQFDSIISSFVTMREKETQGTHRLVIIVTIFVASIFILLLFSVVILFLLSYRSSRKQQEIYMQYAEKIAVPHRDSLPSPVITDVAEAAYMIEDKTSSGRSPVSKTAKSLPSPSEDHEKEKLRITVEQCKALGEAIDSATQRKNCSKNAAELVYKISVLLGKPTREAMIYYAVGLVYDIGFLSVDSSLMTRPRLTDDEYEAIKKHTTSGLHMIHFVDSQYRQVFVEGITMHHENMDGSGYPEGLKGKEIPYIARVIRVVDSYVSMISSRVYRAIYDKETAFQKLSEEKGLYDEKIMEALSNII